MSNGTEEKDVNSYSEKFNSFMKDFGLFDCSVSIRLFFKLLVINK